MEKIGRFIEEQLESWEVPGCAVIAMKAGETVFNAGFGVRDLETKRPVTPRTLFAIGSVTKSFTAAAVGALVEDGLLEWERPIRDWWSDFRLYDPVAGERVTPKDFLCHRSGLPRHDAVWFDHPGRSRADLSHRLRHLRLSRDLRQGFQYCNLGYIAVGHLVELLTGKTWEEFIASRFFEPLGMRYSNFSVKDSQRSNDFSKGHERRDGRIVEVPMRDIDACGPAGSINSCLDDMRQWLLANLQGGRVNDRQVISTETIRQMQRVQIGLPESPLFHESTHFGYGLGWMIGQYRGRRLIAHSGGIDGFLTECAFLPNEGAGVVVLSNSTSGQMKAVVAGRVLDELLGLEPIDWFSRCKQLDTAYTEGGKKAEESRARVEGANLLRPVEEYAGEYSHPGYGTISIAVKADNLVAHFGSETLVLHHRHFDVFDLKRKESEDTPYPLTFLTAPEGDVMALTVPFESLVESIRFERQPDARTRDPEFLQGLIGTYVMGPATLVIEARKNGLTLSENGFPASTLLPGRGLRFRIKGKPNASVEFVIRAESAVERVIYQPVGVFSPKEEPDGLKGRGSRG